MTTSARQTLSKRLFNSKHRLDVALAVQSLAGEILDFEQVFLTSGAPRTAVHLELQLLVELSLLQRLEGGRVVLYQVIDPSDPFWPWVAALDRRAFSGPGVSTSGRES